MDAILLILSYGLSIIALQFKSYRHILLGNSAAFFLAAVYLYINETHVGAAVALIAAGGAFTQFCFPLRQNTLNALSRNVIAIGFVIVAVSLLYQKPSDLLPCTANILNRVSEAQKRQQLIRCSYCFGAILWAFYGIDNQLYLFAVAEICVAIGAMVAFVRHEKARAAACAPD